MKRTRIIVGALAPLIVAPLFVAALAFASWGDDQDEPGVDPPLAAVQRLMRAFNAHDVDGMLDCVGEDVGWYSVEGAAVSVEAEGRSALRTGMASYFSAIPSVRAEIEDSMVTGRYVVVRERAFWTRGDTEVSQSSLAVYEVAAGLVARVWYYPAER